MFSVFCPCPFARNDSSQEHSNDSPPSRDCGWKRGERIGTGFREGIRRSVFYPARQRDRVAECRSDSGDLGVLFQRSADRAIKSLRVRPCLHRESRSQSDKQTTFGRWMLWCRGTESNCRHQPFQGCALPTELPRHTGFILELDSEGPSAPRTLTTFATTPAQFAHISKMIDQSSSSFT